MRDRVIGALGTVLLTSVTGYGWYLAHAEPPRTPAVAVAALSVAPGAALGFDELLEPGALLKPTAKVQGLAGRRVTLVGFMAQLELPPRGAFYLGPRPMRGDEAGGGTADLPPNSVLVLSPSLASSPAPFIAGPLEVTGVLEVGNQPDPDGRVSAFRVRLDAMPRPVPPQGESI